MEPASQNLPDNCIMDAQALYAALVEIGKLTKWAGHLEGPLPPTAAAASDLRKIRRIAEEATGQAFLEYT